MSSDDIAAMILPHIRELPPYQTGKTQAEIQQHYKVNKFIRLVSNENPLGPSPKAVAAIQHAASNINCYPDVTGSQLKAKISQHLNVAVEHITLGNGSGEILTLLSKTFFEARKEVIYSQYSFALYTIIVQMMNAKPVIIPTRDWQQDVEGMLAAINDDTRAIIIGNPNNPTGSLIKKQAMKKFIEQVPDHIAIIIDEAYHDFVAERDDYSSALSWQSQHPNVIVVRTFSKAYGLAGVRVGFSITHPTFTEVLNRVREPFNVNSLAQVAAVASLEDQAHLQKTLTCNQQGLEQITQGLKQLGLDIIPSYTNFITFDVKKPAQPIYEKLLQHGIMIRPLINYGLTHHLRVSIGLPEANSAFLQALKNAL